MSIGSGNHGVAKWMEFFLYDKSANAARQDKKEAFSFQNQISEKETHSAYFDTNISLKVANSKGEQS